MALHASITMPLGGADWSSVRWEGLGRRDRPSAESDSGTIWRSADHVGEIEVAEREAHAADDTGPKDRPDSVTLTAKGLAN